MAAKWKGGKVFTGVLLVLVSLGLAFFAGCGGGGGGGTPPAAGEVPVVLGQPGTGDTGGHFPFAVGNQWQYQVTVTETGLPPETFNNTVTITETRAVGQQTVTVFQESNPDGFGIPAEEFLVKDLNGIANFGNSDPTDTVTPLLVPFWEVRFPLETGASFVALDREGIDFGEDLDGDAVNEKFDLDVVVTTAGFESVTVPAGTFANSARIRADITLSIILSTDGTRVPATDVSTSWYAPGVGLVRSEEVFQMTFQGVTSTETTVEVLVTSTVAEEPPPGTFVVLNDTFAWIGNTRLTVADAEGVLANDTGATSSTVFQGATLLGGSVSLTAGGGFTYDPPLGFGNPAVPDTFTYTATDGTDQLSGTVTINLNDRAWYVRNSPAAASPNGTNSSPFTTLSGAQGTSAAGDFIVVMSGDGSVTGQNAGIALAADQKLIGQGVAFVYPWPAIAASRGVLAAGIPPAISNVTGGIPADLPVVTLANGNEVAGIRFTSTANEAIVRGNSITGFNIHDNEFLGSLREDVLLVNPQGTGSIMNNTMSGADRPSLRITNIDPTTAAVTNIQATININGNNVSIDPAAGRDNVDIVFDSASIGGTSVTLNMTGNTFDALNVNGDALAITAQGDASLILSLDGNTISNAGAEGLNLDSLGTSRIIATLTGNTVTGNTLEGMDLQTSGTSEMKATVDGNTFTLNGGVSGFNAVSQAGTTFCLTLTNNSSDTGFTVNGDATSPIVFTETNNTGVVNTPGNNVDLVTPCPF